VSSTLCFRDLGHMLSFVYNAAPNVPSGELALSQVQRFQTKMVFLWLLA
jgi:hypothetical protein